MTDRDCRNRWEGRFPPPPDTLLIVRTEAEVRNLQRFAPENVEVRSYLRLGANRFARVFHMPPEPHWTGRKLADYREAVEEGRLRLVPAGTFAPYAEGLIQWQA